MPECYESNSARLEAAITRLGGTFIGYELMEDYTSGKGQDRGHSCHGKDKFFRRMGH